MKFKYLLGALGALLLFFLIFAWMFDEGEPIPDAPGCGGSGGITGCLGKSFIRNATLSPEVHCVLLDPNNCNGGVLGVENICDSDLTLGNVTIPAGEYQLVELVRAADGSVGAIKPEGNFGSYNPADLDELSIGGSINGQNVTLSYVKENVCGEPSIQ